MKIFPLMTDQGESCRMEMPWDMIAPHEAQALLNHNQSLYQLARRGGLSWSEALAVLHDRRWEPMESDKAEWQLRLKIEDHRNQNKQV